jgi:hypothetical protein
MENQNSALAVPGTDHASEISLAIAALENVQLDKLKPSFSLVQEYLKIEKGQKVRGIFAGVTLITLTDETTGEAKEVEAIRLVVIEEGAKKMKIHAGANLVGSLKRSGIAPGQAIEVFLKDQEKNGAKTINIFDVYALA